MLIVKSLFLFFMIFILVACVVWLYLTIDHIGNFIKNKKEKNIELWNGYDLDERLVALVIIIAIPILCIIWVVSDTTQGYTSVFSFMMQFIGVSLAVLAATIAFRNYRRKSGDHISYILDEDLDRVKVILLRNDKDKSVSIFAIDVILTDGQRIRLIDFTEPKFNPIILSSFEIKKVNIKSVHLYGDKRFNSSDEKIISEVIFITDNDTAKSKKFSVPSLRDCFIKQKDILRAYRIQNIPNNYKDEDVDRNTEYWVYIAEESLEEQHYFNNHVLTGFIQNGVFFLTNSSLEYIEQENRKPLKKYCLKKMHNQKIEGEYSSRDKDYYDDYGGYLVSGLFEPDSYPSSKRNIQGFHLFWLKKIEKLEINNML